jgi:mannose-1-phosphate guanylyltransferase
MSIDHSGGAGATWAIVLAAGDGTRLRSLVRLVEDEPLPKQYATLVGSRSLLQTTIERVGTLAPPERTIVVVSRSHEALARRQLADWADIEILAQPENRGTALGVLLPLARLRRRDPDASVAIFPSDHYVPRPAPFLEGVRGALRSSGVTLIGVAPDRADPDLGWIVPDRPLGGGLEAVARFVEKPGRAAAAELFRKGALWNAFVIAGRLRELWALVAAHLPLDAAAFGGAAGPATLDELYLRARPADLSRAVLEKACDLQVARVEGSGWADWGTPERVVDSLDGTPALDRLLRRIIDGQRRGGGLTLTLAARVASALHPSTPGTRGGGWIDGP